MGSHLANGTRSRFYIDRGGRDKKCAGPAGCVSSHVLERGVIDGLAAHVAGQITDRAVRRAFADRIAAVATKQPDAGARIDRALAEAERRRDTLIDAVEAGTLRAEEVTARLATVRADIARLESDRIGLPTTPATPAGVHTQLEALVQRARNVVELARTATGPELRALLRPWTVNMTFDRTTRVLTMRMRTLAALLLPATSGAQGLHEQTRYVIERRAVLGQGPRRGRP
jgi:hypothetical protein